MSDDPYYKKDCGFLNYLLNLKLYNNVIKKNISVFNFYNELESHCSEELKYSFSTCEVYNINKDELDKMTILYNLHAKRNEILGIINSQENLEASMLLEPSTECFTKYTKGLAMCNNKKNNKFCDLLEIFKNNYEELYPKVETKRQGYSKYLKSLSENENTNIISTSVIGSAVGLIPLFGILYKFTPVGQLFKSNKRVATDGKRYNDDDMKKISLMDHENEQLKFKQEAYNIKYQSV
ncbi:Plasmodium vivax Vir protein, putative [Plasmodium vivax]|uniref:Vir protein, putative n=1 Tax=Plasmodium vivax TaxID=5855 RepID=A0A1G4E6S6_PLAVI|nr:Plasmodium vivax Vir protein, putative [Plasmodium vivax]